MQSEIVSMMSFLTKKDKSASMFIIITEQNCSPSWPAILLAVYPGKESRLVHQITATRSCIAYTKLWSYRYTEESEYEPQCGSEIIRSNSVGVIGGRFERNGEITENNVEHCLGHW